MRSIIGQLKNSRAALQRSLRTQRTHWRGPSRPSLQIILL